MAASPHRADVIADGREVALGPILLQKSAGSVGPTFPGPYECPSKKHVGDHPNSRPGNERLSQPRYDGIERDFLTTTGFAPIFVPPNFRTFATISATSGRQPLTRASKIRIVLRTYQGDFNTDRIEGHIMKLPHRRQFLRLAGH